MKETTTRKIINNFIDKKAFEEKRAIQLIDVEVDIKESEKNYIIENLINSAYLVKTEEGTLWFDQTLWNKTIRKLTMQYSFIISIPMIIAFVLYIAFF